MSHQFDLNHNGSKISFLKVVDQIHFEGTWVHVGGAMVRDFENASAGDAVLDSIGNRVLRFKRYLGSCTPFEVKFWGILDRLLTLLNKDYKGPQFRQIT